MFKGILEGGKRLEKGWGAKTIPEGGYHSLPEKFSVPGAMFVGDAVGLVNVPTLKGIHYAMWSGILAAESIYARLKEAAGNLDSVSKSALSSYDDSIRSSFIHKELYEVRNMRHAFKHGFFVGGAMAGLMTLTKGAFPGGKIEVGTDSSHSMFNSKRTYPKPDGSSTFDKLDSVHASGNKSRDNQPNHIRLKTDVPEAMALAWIKMCPAQVYEWHEEEGKKTLMINGPNCIHCGAITAKGGRLTPPEGGSGPEYSLM